MNFPIPDFVPVPSAEIMQTISIVSWIVIGVGVLLIANHGIQLLF